MTPAEDKNPMTLLSKEKICKHRMKRQRFDHGSANQGG